MDDIQYVSEKFIEEFKNINSKIGKQWNLRNKLSPTSKEYQNILRNEIKLLQEKRKLLEL